jgi:uncharacterized protein (TIGR02597 family)
MKLLRLPLFAAAASLVLAPAYLNAQTTVATDPVGFVTTTITNSANGTTPITTPYSPVLFQPAAATGLTTGLISSVTSNTITVDSAGWGTSSTNNLPSSLAYVLIKSGPGEGLLLRVTANTANTMTVDTLGNNLAAIPVVASNSFQLLQGETIGTMFGTNTAEFGVIGGTSQLFNSNRTDRIVMTDASGVNRTYYFNTTTNRWLYVGGGNTDRAGTPISPYSAVFYSRIGTSSIQQVTTGSVPVNNIKLLVRPNGTTYLGTVFPVGATLGSLGIENLPGWKTASPNNNAQIKAADKVLTRSGNAISTFYYTSGLATNSWRRVGSGANQNTAPLPIGGGVSVVRTGSNAPAQILTINKPYSLN